MRTYIIDAYFDEDVCRQTVIRGPFEPADLDREMARRHPRPRATTLEDTSPHVARDRSTT